VTVAGGEPLERDGGEELSAIDLLRWRGEAFLQEVSAEYHAAHAGHASEAALQPIYAHHAAAFDDEALRTAVALWRLAVQGRDDFRSARCLVDWLVESRVGRVLAPIEEQEIAWESQATIVVADGIEEPYQRAAITIANTGDVTARHALDDARAALVAAELAPLRRERLQREHAVVAELGIAPTYHATWEKVSGIPLTALRAECEAFLRDTQALWDELLPFYVKRGLGMHPSDVTRADLLALMRAPAFDAFFAPDRMEREVRRHVVEMGISPDADGRVRFDTVDRPGKRARAFCAPVQIPDLVHLVLRPHGGQNDWMTLLHELGHALHFGYMDRALPFEFRWLGDNSVTEGFAMLFDHRLKDAGWLRRYTGLGPMEIPNFLHSQGFEELHFVRRYAAKLIYETELHAEGVVWDAMPDRYVEILTTATGFRYQRADAFVDVDPRFYAARYLRAWQLQAVLEEGLRERFDADWWRNPKAGPWMVGELFRPGQRELADEMSRRVANRGLSFAPVIAGVTRMVG